MIIMQIRDLKSWIISRFFDYLNIYKFIPFEATVIFSFQPFLFFQDFQFCFDSCYESSRESAQNHKHIHSQLGAANISEKETTEKCLMNQETPLECKSGRIPLHGFEKKGFFWILRCSCVIPWKERNERLIKPEADTKLKNIKSEIIIRTARSTLLCSLCL